VASSYAGFLNGGWHMTDALTLNAGVRYTKEKKDYHYGRTDIYGQESANFFDPFSGQNLNGQIGRYAGSKTDYRVNLDYRWNANVMTYASVSTGFKGGGTNPRPFFVAQVKPFKPEDLTAYEVGIKTDFFDRKLRADASVFLNKYKDIQITLLNCPETPAPLPCARPDNAGNADIKGAELELFAQPTAALSLDASYSYLNFKYTKLDPATFIPVYDIAPGMIRSKFSLGAQYELALPGGTLTPRVDLSYQGSYYSNGINSNLNRVPGYHVTNAQMVWRPGSSAWTFTAAAKNVFNKLYYTSVFDFTTIGNPWVYGTPAAPREYQVQVQRKF
jgi:iron complex outermembrane recepter protein